MKRPDTAHVRDIIERGVEEVIERSHMELLLQSGKKLRVKFGIDPTGDKIHIGRAVALWKLRAFQDAGHKIVLIIGDFTAQIGDPSDKLEKRPFLSPVQVKKNLKNYLAQIGKILNLSKVDIRYNSSWLKKLNFQEISQLAESFTLQQMARRRNFKDRLDRGEDISMREMLYPLMQGYDSVAVKADIEIGGSDQLFNLLAGRKIQEFYKQKPQDVLTTKMLSGLDGRKMSTSWGNVINITDTADDQFGKVMSMRDEALPEYIELAAGFSREEEAALLAACANRSMNPRDIKMRVAYAIVARYHGAVAAQAASEKFAALFSKKQISAEALPVLAYTRGMPLVDLVVRSGVVKSKSEARRLIDQGAVRINVVVVRGDAEKGIVPGAIIKIGKRHFFKIT